MSEKDQSPSEPIASLKDRLESEVDMEPLKHCPFCGAPGALQQTAGLASTIVWYVGCANDTCDMRVVTPFCTSAAIAWRLWNTRDTPDKEAVALNGVADRSGAFAETVDGRATNTVADTARYAS